MHPTWGRISSNCSLSVWFASLDARILLNFIHSGVIFFFQPWVPISILFAWVVKISRTTVRFRWAVGQCSLLKRGWLFDIGTKNPTLIYIWGFFKFISKYKDHYKPISLYMACQSQGFNVCCPLLRCRSNPNEVDLSFSGSQWLLSSQACCRRDLRGHEWHQCCRIF